ncbi:MAG: hypothetical protein K2X38_19170 [Gemmataceae bacterium]|nr:hypothetical protein [Gemmataceae bacterium]
MSGIRASRQTAAVILTVAAGVLRLVTNVFGIFNCNPMYAGCTFGGSRIRGWMRYVLPVVLWLGTDYALWASRGFNSEYQPFSQAWQWFNLLSLGIYVAIGRWFIGESRSWNRIGAASVIGAVQFFLISNFGSFLWSPDYVARDSEAFIRCYARALEFAWPTLIANLVFTPAWFAIHEAVIAMETTDEAVLDEAITEKIHA